MTKPRDLKYIGDGAALPDIPARDLRTDEVADLPLNRQALIKSGLYEVSADAEPPQPSEEIT